MIAPYIAQFTIVIWVQISIFLIRSPDLMDQIVRSVVSFPILNFWLWFSVISVSMSLPLFFLIFNWLDIFSTSTTHKLLQTSGRAHSCCWVKPQILYISLIYNSSHLLKWQVNVNVISFFSIQFLEHMISIVFDFGVILFHDIPEIVNGKVS